MPREDMKEALYWLYEKRKEMQKYYKGVRDQKRDWTGIVGPPEAKIPKEDEQEMIDDYRQAKKALKDINTAIKILREVK